MRLTVSRLSTTVPWVCIAIVVSVANLSSATAARTPSSENATISERKRRTLHGHESDEATGGRAPLLAGPPLDEVRDIGIELVGIFTEMEVPGLVHGDHPQPRILLADDVIELVAAGEQRGRIIA